MKKKDDPPHSPPPSFRLELCQTIDEFARNPAGPATEKLIGMATSYCSNRYRGGLNAEEIAEIAREAVVSTIPKLLDSSLSAEMRAKSLCRVIDNLRKALKRYKKNHTSLEAYEENPSHVPYQESHEEAFLLRDHLQSVADIVFSNCSEALGHLRFKDHDLIVDHYDLQDFGFHLKLETPPRFPSEAAYAKAMYRARKRWREMVLSLLEFELEVARPSKRELIVDAMKVLEADGLCSVLPFKSLR